MAQIEFYNRDIQILRQSQQKMAFDLAQSKGVILSMIELQRMTDIFVQCCIRPIDNDLKAKIKEMDTWLKEQSKKQK